LYVLSLDGWGSDLLYDNASKLQTLASKLPHIFVIKWLRDYVSTLQTLASKL